MEAVKESLAIAEEYYKKSCYSSMILIYHRVTELDLDPHLLAVSPRNFEDHLRYLQENFAVISLKELVRCLQKGYVPPKSIVITFDDGYADNLYNAKPLLEKYGVPATVFVTAGIFGSPRREFWWDELEQIFLVDKPIFSKPLTVNYCGCEYTWNIDSLEKAKESYSALHSILKTLTHEERLTTIDSLFKWAGIKPVIRDSHRPLSCAELQQLDAGGLVEIGAHTLNHVLLSAESPTKQEDEISLSKLVLQNILGKSVMSFSYPFGGGRRRYQRYTDIRQAGRI